MPEIRKSTEKELEAILEIWLKASLRAHDFIAPSFWHAQVKDMRECYLPAAEVFHYEENKQILGFYALLDNNLAALFVAPTSQRRGIGQLLLNHAKNLRNELCLSVYSANLSAFRFYRAQGFKLTGEQQDQHTGHPEYRMKFSKVNNLQENNI